MPIRGNITFYNHIQSNLSLRAVLGTEEFTEGLTVQKSRQTEFAIQSVWEIIIKGQKKKNNKRVSVPSVGTEADYVQ